MSNSKPSPDSYTVQVTAPSAGLTKNSSFWYGGQVSYIAYKGYRFYLDAVGDILVGYTAKAGGEQEWFKDRNNGGQMREWFGDIFPDDKSLYEAINNHRTKKYPQLEMGNNNWWECFVQDSRGQMHDLMWALNTDNYFEAIDEIVDGMDDVIEEIERVYGTTDN